MILTPDSSAQDAPATSPKPEPHVAGASGAPRVSVQDMTSPYPAVQLATAHRLTSSMPTMDSTVSSAKPEPELNIGTKTDGIR